MNVLFITGDFPHPHAPAHGLFNEYLARGLAEEHAVRVICPIPWATVFKNRLKRKRISPARSGAGGHQVVHPTYLYPPKILRNQYGSFLWHSVRGHVRELLREFKPDVVLGYWAHPDGEVAVRIAQQLGVPSGVIIGGSDVLLITRNAGRRRKVAHVLKAADAVIAVNRHLKEHVAGFGVSEHKIHTWDQGVDAKFSPGSRAEARRRLGIAESGHTAVWVGRMVPVKALGMLVKACAALKASGLDFTLHLVGDGPLRKELRRTFPARGLTSTVRFVGTQLHDQLPDWYRAADITVLSSSSEGLPNVLRESLACGTPFVSTRVGGISEIAGDRGHWLVEAGDADGFAAAMKRLFTEPSLLPSAFRAVTWLQSAKALMEIFHPLPASMPQAASSKEVQFA